MQETGLTVNGRDQGQGTGHIAALSGDAIAIGIVAIMAANPEYLFQIINLDRQGATDGSAAGDN